MFYPIVLHCCTNLIDVFFENLNYIVDLFYIMNRFWQRQKS